MRPLYIVLALLVPFSGFAQSDTLLPRDTTIIKGKTQIGIEGKFGWADQYLLLEQKRAGGTGMKGFGIRIQHNVLQEYFS